MRLLDLGYLARVLTPSIRESHDDDQSASQSMVWKGSKIEKGQLRHLVLYSIAARLLPLSDKFDQSTLCAEPISQPPD